MESQGYEEELLQHWFSEAETQYKSDGFSEKDIWEISTILQRAERPSWSRTPRLYIVLRMIQKLDVIERFIEQGISDLGFPFNQKSLPHILGSQSDRANFLDHQRAVCNSKALNLEQPRAKHVHFHDSNEIPLKKIGELGKGSSGVVERVISTVSYREYALKLIRRGTTYRKDKQVLRGFEKELSHLKRLSEDQAHRHIIEVIGSYTEPRYVGILFPVAECNLAEFMESPGLEDRRWKLRTYFGCLTSALAFLHDNKIRHKDIKPQNILIQDLRPYFTDFGVAVDWSDHGHSISQGPTAMTPRYGAPEVASSEPRSYSADIWSLGCVFLEMWTVLRGRSLKEIAANFTADKQLLPYHSSTVDLSAWIHHLHSLPGASSDQAPSKWLNQMLVRDRKSRCSAYPLLESIRETSMDPSGQYLYMCRYCLDDEETAESVPNRQRRIFQFDCQQAAGNTGCNM
ncbi:kinase-like domain-containing protein [Paraphoma chrysanthemicola]|nr:kinase-like domain-containing protein [Paraphoma chrysanthemicola]